MVQSHPCRLQPATPNCTKLHQIAPNCTGSPNHRRRMKNEENTRQPRKTDFLPQENARNAKTGLYIVYFPCAHLRFVAANSLRCADSEGSKIRVAQFTALSYSLRHESRSCCEVVAAGVGHSIDRRRLRRHFGSPELFALDVAVARASPDQTGTHNKLTTGADRVQRGFVPIKLNYAISTRVDGEDRRPYCQA